MTSRLPGFKPVISHFDMTLVTLSFWRFCVDKYFTDLIRSDIDSRRCLANGSGLVNLRSMATVVSKGWLVSNRSCQQWFVALFLISRLLFSLVMVFSSFNFFITFHFFLSSFYSLLFSLFCPFLFFCFCLNHIFAAEHVNVWSRVFSGSDGSYCPLGPDVHVASRIKFFFDMHRLHLMRYMDDHRFIYGWHFREELLALSALKRRWRH